MTARIVKEVKQALQRLFSDTKVEPGVTKTRLLEVRDEIDMLVDSISEEPESDPED